MSIRAKLFLVPQLQFQKLSILCIFNIDFFQFCIIQSKTMRGLNDWHRFYLVLVFSFHIFKYWVIFMKDHLLTFRSPTVTEIKLFIMLSFCLPNVPTLTPWFCYSLIFVPIALKLNVSEREWKFQIEDPIFSQKSFNSKKWNFCLMVFFENYIH